MRLRSLRLRLFVAATIAVAAALAVAGVLLTGLFERHVTRHYDAELQSYLRQLSAAIEFSPDGRISLGQQLQDARFGEPLSGLYWQIEEDKSGFILGSRSLWDTRIPLPKDALAKGAVDSHILPGPQGTRLRVQERMIVFDLPSGSRSLRMAVAMDVAEIAAARSGFAADIWPSLATIGLLLLVAAWFYIGIGLRPLEGIRRSLNAVRNGASRRLEGDFPSEVMPLVVEANALLAAQDDSLARARARATDLAHGLKTPLAVLQSDAERLKARGQDDIGEEVWQLAEQMRRHVQRELARARLRGGETAKPQAVRPVAERIMASLRRTPLGETLSWVLDIPADLTLSADTEDMTELFGSLLDNACKWARSEVRMEAQVSDAGICIRVLDDGSGVPEAALASLADRGVRLDESVPGSGLGLAIARDIVTAYRGSLVVRNRTGGGFAVILEFPPAQRSSDHA
jgi:signal transduction histidine kinase